jgi:hypothetical protein
MNDRFTIRVADPDDAVALQRLAALDSKSLPPGRLLVAEVDGELWAAVSLHDAHDVADPFRPSGELALMVAQRAGDLRMAAARAARRERRQAAKAAKAAKAAVAA